VEGRGLRVGEVGWLEENVIGVGVRGGESNGSWEEEEDEEVIALKRWANGGEGILRGLSAPLEYAERETSY
jgi:hypothetical protein